MKLGEKIKSLRKSKGVSQEETSSNVKNKQKLSI